MRKTHASHLNHAAIYEFERWVITKKGYAKNSEYTYSKLMMYMERYVYNMKK